jgi:hypothetical protein
MRGGSGNGGQCEGGGSLPPLVLPVRRRPDAFDLAAPESDYDEAAFGVGEADEHVGQIPPADAAALPVEPLILGQAKEGPPTLLTR